MHRNDKFTHATNIPIIKRSHCFRIPILVVVYLSIVGDYREISHPRMWLKTLCKSIIIIVCTAVYIRGTSLYISKGQINYITAPVSTLLPVQGVYKAKWTFHWTNTSCKKQAKSRRRSL